VHDLVEEDSVHRGLKHCEVNCVHICQFLAPLVDGYLELLHVVSHKLLYFIVADVVPKLDLLDLGSALEL